METSAASSSSSLQKQSLSLSSALPQTAQQFCQRVLCGGELADKLLSPRGPDGKLLPFVPDLPSLPSLPPGGSPARAGVLQIREGATALPRLSQLTDPVARAQCLERFAHHELQAIELYAWMLLAYPELPLGLRRALLLTLEEEQTHLQLYIDRMRDFDWYLGASPLTDYLWQHHQGIARSPEPGLSFLCAMGLTFEQANLDFALLFRDGFRRAGDEQSALLMQRIHDDEIRHVRIANNWLRKLKRPAHTDVQTYVESVPFPLSAARAKGRRFIVASRQQAGLSDGMIALVRAARPPYVPAGQSRGTLEDGPEEAVSSSQSPSALPDKRAAGLGRAGAVLWLLPNLGAEERRPMPVGARGFLRGLLGAWSTLFDASGGEPMLLPPGEPAAQAHFRSALAAQGAGPALPVLATYASGGMLAWLNTQEAAAQAQELGRTLVGPSPQIVEVVHDKAFAHQQSLRLGLVPDCISTLITVLSAEDLQRPAALLHLNERLAIWPDWARARFTLKPRHGTSGRGRLMGEQSLPDTEATHASLRALAERGGCLLEPWLSRIADRSVQLFVPPGLAGVREGRVVDLGLTDVQVLGSTTQIVTPSGQILGNRGLFTADGQLLSGALPDEEAALQAAAHKLGQAAATAGYYGIAGVDAFSFVDHQGQPALRSVVELNARFTTGTVALGLCKRALATGLAREVTGDAGAGAWALLLKSPPGSLLGTLDPRQLRIVSPLARGPSLLLARNAQVLDDFLAAAQREQIAATPRHRAR